MLTGDGATGGLVLKPGSDTAFVFMSGMGNFHAQVETVTHEIGHLAEKKQFAKAPESVKQENRAEFERWRAQAATGTVGGLFGSTLPFEYQRAVTRQAEEQVILNESAFVLSSYWTSFDE